MTVLVVVLLALAVAGGAMAVALATRARRDQTDQLQVVPGVDSGAPVAWAGAHTPEAKLHRRLVAAVRSMRAQPSLGGAVFVAQRAALEQEALRIDARLIAFDALVGERRQEGIEQVASLVERFESAVADLVTASLDDPSMLEAAISESEIRLRALEEARAEVERLDRPQTG
jgi:hypothetical protein